MAEVRPTPKPRPRPRTTSDPDADVQHLLTTRPDRRQPERSYSEGDDDNAPVCSDAPTPKPRGVRTSVLTSTSTTANSVASAPRPLTSRVESIPEEDMYGGPVTNGSSSSELTSQLQSLRAQIDPLKREMASLQDQKASLDCGIEQRQREEEELSQRVEQRQREEEELSQRVEQRRREEEELSRRVEQRRREEEELSQRVEQRRREEEELSQRVEQRRHEEEELSQRVEWLRAEEGQLQARVNRLQEKEEEGRMEGGGSASAVEEKLRERELQIQHRLDEASDRESHNRQEDMRLQRLADQLHMQKKHLDHREFDLENFRDEGAGEMVGQQRAELVEREEKRLHQMETDVRERERDLEQRQGNFDTWMKEQEKIIQQRLKELNTGPGQSGPPAHQSSPPYAPPITSPSYNPPAFPPNPTPSPPYNPHIVTPAQHEQYTHQITPSPPTQAPLHSHTQPQVRPPPLVGGLSPHQWRDIGVPQGGNPSMGFPQVGGDFGHLTAAQHQAPPPSHYPQPPPSAASYGQFTHIQQPPAGASAGQREKNFTVAGHAESGVKGLGAVGFRDDSVAGSVPYQHGMQPSKTDFPQGPSPIHGSSSASVLNDLTTTSPSHRNDFSSSPAPLLKPQSPASINPPSVMTGSTPGIIRSGGGGSGSFSAVGVASGATGSSSRNRLATARPKINMDEELAHHLSEYAPPPQTRDQISADEEYARQLQLELDAARPPQTGEERDRELALALQKDELPSSSISDLASPTNSGLQHAVRDTLKRQEEQKLQEKRDFELAQTLGGSNSGDDLNDLGS